MSETYEIGHSWFSRLIENYSEILESPSVDPLPDSVIARLDEILRAADRELA